MPLNNAAFFNYDTTNSQVSQFINEEEAKYRVFTGADLTAYIGNVKIGKLAGITCSVTRETMPVFTTGSPDTKAFAKGKRGIAGNLVFTQFDRHAILRDLINTKNTTLQNLWAQLGTFDITSQSNPNSQWAKNNTNSSIADALAVSSNSNSLAQKELLETAILVANRKVNYVDQIPPFDITVTFVNDAGDAAIVAIHGVQLVNEGWGYTLDDLHSETAYTYLARAITPLEAVGNPNALYAPGAALNTL